MDNGTRESVPTETINGHKDPSKGKPPDNDVPFTAGSFHNSSESYSSPMPDGSVIKYKYDLGNTASGLSSGASSVKDNTNFNVKLKSSKEEKQRQNEEIVILESSSLSSETGSWESVFPPKFYGVPNPQSQVKDSPYKVTSCFIDAATLVDDDDTLEVANNAIKIQGKPKLDHIIPSTSQPVACDNRHDLHSDADSEDSLEQNDLSDDPDSRRDLSSTIFEMTPVTEDSLNTFEHSVQTQENKTTSNIKPITESADKDIQDLHHNIKPRFSETFFTSDITTPPTTMVHITSTYHGDVAQSETESISPITYNPLYNYNGTSSTPDRHSFDENLPSNTRSPLLRKKVANVQTSREPDKLASSSFIVTSSGNTSTMSSRTTETSQVDWERNEERAASESSEDLTYRRLKKYSESSPIISGGVSIEDHLPLTGSNVSSPIARRKIENVPIVSGAYIPEATLVVKKSPKQSSASAWVVDMSSSSSINESTLHKPGPLDKANKSLKSESKSSIHQDSSKSRSSIESESSDKSGHKYFIDLSKLPDPFPPKKEVPPENQSDKKNIFSMYIDFGEKSTVKEMPARLMSLSERKHSDSATPKPLENKRSASAAKRTVVETWNKHIPEKVAPKPEILVQTKNKDKSGDLFVKLSDLDNKPSPKMQLDSITEHCVSEIRMTRSIPESTWTEKAMSATSKSTEIMHSFHSENALSLNRLFPHLKEFSRSTPGSLGSRTLSPLRMSSSPAENEEHPVSDMSEMSSVQSSYRSVVEHSTTEETSQMSNLIGNSQSQLGQDLLRMFLEEIAPDVIVEVSGRRVKAHKCILSSRCQYFAGMLSGGWVESAGNVIVLPTFSYTVVHFALCHIYSGMSTIPDSINILELATIADMLGLEGLKEAIMYHLKVKYCHHFHKPCTVCIVGVLECFPLSSAYGLDDLYRKCLKWITRYFCKIWITKAFATLPRELLEKCLQQHIVHLTVENVVETVCGCGLIADALPEARWAETVARMCRRLVSAAAHFAAPRLCDVLRFVVASPPEAPYMALQSLNECITTAIEFTPPEESCRVYEFLSDLMKEIKPQMPTPDLINNDPPKVNSQNRFIYSYTNSWRMQCEAVLVRSAPKAVMTQAFKDLSPELRKRLRELGCIMFGSQSKSASSSPFDKRNCRTPTVSRTTASRNMDIDKVRDLFVPYSQKPALPSGSVRDLQVADRRVAKVRPKSDPPKVRTTKAQEQRTQYNITHCGTSQSQERPSNSVLSRPQKFENTKPRYLEPKRNNEPERKSLPKRLAQKTVSSSESSRNTSPIQPRVLRNSRAKASNVISSQMRRDHPAAKQGCSQTISVDSLAPTTRPASSEPSCDSQKESFAENTTTSNGKNIRSLQGYDTYTKKKHGPIKPDACTAKDRPERFCRAITSVPDAKTRGIKTKIPVYIRNVYTYDIPVSIRHKAVPAEPLKEEKNKPRDRIRVSTSLMCATKSSSAKIVTKVKEVHHKFTEKKAKGKTIKKEDPRKNEIPVMERSGTFVKEESSFGDTTTNIDVA